MALKLSTGLRDGIMTEFAALFEDGIIDVYSGTRPADGDATEGSGTRLVRIVRDGGASLTSGTVTTGKMYMITNAGTGADFTNIGAPANTLYTVFKATGTTPTEWGGATLKEDVGLVFDAPSEGKIAKPADATWKGIGEASGTAAWFRFYDPDIETGASTTEVRFDGSVGTSSGDMRMVSTTIAIGASQTIDTLEVTFPAT
jgi:hypothetical protein